jgi:prevent-host-death family protein
MGNFRGNDSRCPGSQNNLSHYLREVKKGRSILITERGKIVATIVPEQEHLDRKAQKISRSGLVTWWEALRCAEIAENFIL